jgi:preprotein translocase subunit YajC
MPKATLAQEILLGERDFELEVLTSAIAKRQKQIAEARAASLQKGDRIILQGLGMGSKYLNGATGTVIGFALKNIKVELDPEVDTRRYSHKMRVPPGLLRVLEPSKDPRKAIGTEEDNGES